MNISLQKSAQFLFLIFISIPHSVAFGWMATLKIMRHNDGHIVRLAGDVHFEAFAQDKNFEKAVQQEATFLINVEKALSDFMTKDNECFIVERTIADIEQISHFVYESDVAFVPLITRINILAHPDIHDCTKAKAAHIYQYVLPLKSTIISYDIRSKYKKLSEISFPTSLQEYIVFLQELACNQHFFKDDLQALINEDNNYPLKFRHFIRYRGEVLIEKINDTSNLENFFINDFADFGYLICIAKNCFNNVTLYLGMQHCHSIAQDLEQLGYKIIFDKGSYTEENLCKNIIPGYRSCDDYRDFFCKDVDQYSPYIVIQ